jgi:adenosyl cobinamide kinase/adenosyl cobinamide phosphate guanylyltransferase
MDVTLVLGGARSGKSRHAEALIARHPAPWVYLATAAAWDDEMRDRIAQHRARRPAGWETVEVPLDLAAALTAAGGRPVLVDCLTLWLTNLMLGEHDVEAATLALEAALDARTAPTVLVSNEVGLGIVPDNALARAFRDRAGLLNQRIAARVANVHFIAAGLPLVLKGRLP